MDFQDGRQIKKFISISQLLSDIRLKSWCLSIRLQGQGIQLYQVENQQMAAILDFLRWSPYKDLFLRISLLAGGIRSKSWYQIMFSGSINTTV